MGVYATAAFVLFCLVSTMDQSYSFIIVSDRCEDVIRGCGKIIDVFMSKRGNTTNLDLGSICHSTAQRSRCFGDCQQEIHDTPVVGLGMKLNNYLCSATRRDQVEALLEQDCVRDGSMDREFDDVMETCLDNVYMENSVVIAEVFWLGDQSRASTLCPSINQLISCLVNAINNHCGSDVEHVVRDILNIVLTDLLSVYLPICIPQLV